MKEALKNNLTIEEKVRLDIPLGIPDLEDQKDILWEEECAKKSEEIERLRNALSGCIELAEFWISQGSEPDMSKERYEVWLALGYHSQQMQAAKAAVQ